MDNFIVDINDKLRGMLDDISDQKNDYLEKLNQITNEIENKLQEVKDYKADFYNRKTSIEKMQQDISDFENDYQNLVDKFKNDELANILIAANKEISSKIDERKRKINKDIDAMNELVDKAENVKEILVKLKAEKKALELCFAKISDLEKVYSNGFNELINYSENNHETIKEIKPDYDIETVTKDIDDIKTDEIEPVVESTNEGSLDKTMQFDTLSLNEDINLNLPSENESEPFTPTYSNEDEDLLNLNDIVASTVEENTVTEAPTFENNDVVADEDDDNITLPSFQEENTVNDDDLKIELPSYEDDDATSGFSLDEIQLASDEYEKIPVAGESYDEDEDDDDDSGFSLDESSLNQEVSSMNDETTDLENLINFGE